MKKEDQTSCIIFVKGMRIFLLRSSWIKFDMKKIDNIDIQNLVQTTLIGFIHHLIFFGEFYSVFNNLAQNNETAKTSE